MRSICAVANLSGVPLLHRGEPDRSHPTALVGHVGRMQTAIKTLAGTHAGLPLQLSRSRPEHSIVRGLLRRHATESGSGQNSAVRDDLIP